MEPNESNITIEDNIPVIESRSQPVSAEYAALCRMKVGQSFTSHKSRDSLYQIARNLRIPVTVLWAGTEEGWRVWKKGERLAAAVPDLAKTIIAKAKAKRKSRASRERFKSYRESRKKAEAQ
jgi:hypothetical protein